jgi:hypothetical protein
MCGAIVRKAECEAALQLTWDLKFDGWLSVRHNMLE